MTAGSQDSVDPLLSSTEVPTARIILGGRFGEEPVSMSRRRLDQFVEAGGQLIDTRTATPMASPNE